MLEGIHAHFYGCVKRRSSFDDMSGNLFPVPVTFIHNCLNLLLREINSVYHSVLPANRHASSAYEHLAEVSPSANVLTDGTSEFVLPAGGRSEPREIGEPVWRAEETRCYYEPRARQHILIESSLILDVQEVLVAGNSSRCDSTTQRRSPIVSSSQGQIGSREIHQSGF